MFSVSPDDYIAVMSETMVFDTCDRGKCIEIEIVNDSYVEIDEKFTVRVDSLHDRIKTDPDRAVVTIENEDCEFISHQHYNYTKRGNEVVISFTDTLVHELSGSNLAHTRRDHTYPQFFTMTLLLLEYW